MNPVVIALSLGSVGSLACFIMEIRFPDRKIGSLIVFGGVALILAFFAAKIQFGL